MSEECDSCKKYNDEYSTCGANSVVSMKPEFVAVGYDNYGNCLTEPDLEQTLDLIAVLEEWKIKVYRKTLRNRNTLEEICLGLKHKEKSVPNLSFERNLK
jgi:hypothetical protein